MRCQMLRQAPFKGRCENTATEERRTGEEIVQLCRAHALTWDMAKGANLTLEWETEQ